MSCVIHLFCIILFANYASTSKAYVESEDAVEGDLRLTGGSKHGSGRVEVYHEDEWGTICTDFWDMDDTAVVCRQLGYSSAIGFSFTKSSKQNMPIWLDNVHCDGVEDKLVDCAHNGWGSHNCKADHSEDVSVECQVGGKGKNFVHHSHNWRIHGDECVFIAIPH